MHCFILLVVYNDTISFAKAKKQHIDNIAEKVSSSGGANKLRALLVSTYDAFVDSNEDTIINSNGDTITSINVNMAVAAEIEAGGGGVNSGTGTGIEEYDKGNGDGTVTDIFQVGNIEEEASNESNDDIVDADDMDISVQEEEKE